MPAPVALFRRPDHHTITETTALSAFRFPGHPAFLDAAACRLGRPDATCDARQITPLGRICDLLAQAAEAEAPRAVAIVESASEFLVQLHIAHEAAEAMLREARAALGMAPPANRHEPDTNTNTTTARQARPDRSAGRRKQGPSSRP